MTYKPLLALLSILTLTTTATPIRSPSPRACSTAYPQTIAFPMTIDIRQDALGTNKQSSQLTFHIPPGAHSCVLIARFPAGYPIESTGNSQVAVHAASGASPGSLVGTVRFAEGTRVVVNSFACAEVMSCVLSMGDGVQAGRVMFEETVEAGLVMEYGC